MKWQCLTILALHPTALDAAERDVIRRVTVDYVTQATVQINSGSEHSSGVVISADGYVLTVAHGMKEFERSVSVRLADGSVHSADVIIQNLERDVGLLKVSLPPDRRLTAVTLTASPARTGDAAMALGFPARERMGASAVLRIGKIVGTHDVTLRSTCILTAGDSGGPLLTLDGRLLGIHQRIGVGRTVNLHLPLASCLEAIKHAFDPGSLNRENTTLPQAFNSLSVSESSHRIWENRKVEIIDSKKDTISWGTVMNDQTIVTKLSLLKPSSELRIRNAKGEVYSVKLLHAANQWDLAFLRLAKPLRDDLPEILATSVHVGDLIFGEQKSGVGIVARVDHHEPAVQGRLGCTLVERNGMVTVESVSPDSAAADAKLQPADQIVAIDRSDITTVASVAAAVRGRQPGEWLTIQYNHRGTRHATTGKLRHPASEMLRRVEYLDGRAGSLSLRRTAFAGVLQHDLPLLPEQMGGPLVTPDGRVVGVNIARRAREAVFAIPIKAVLAELKSISPVK